MWYNGILSHFGSHIQKKKKKIGLVCLFACFTKNQSPALFMRLGLKQLSAISKNLRASSKDKHLPLMRCCWERVKNPTNQESEVIHKKEILNNIPSKLQKHALPPKGNTWQRAEWQTDSPGRSLPMPGTTSYSSLKHSTQFRIWQTKDARQRYVDCNMHPSVCSEWPWQWHVSESTQTGSRSNGVFACLKPSSGYPVYSEIPNFLPQAARPISPRLSEVHLNPCH